MTSQPKINQHLLEEILSLRHKGQDYPSLATLPAPDMLKDCTKAAKRIAQAMQIGESITIVGDYDVDGIVSTSIMVDFFSQLEYEVDYIIPNRFKHGYGLSKKIIEMIDSGLVITVDNGISAHDAALLCTKKGLDLIITDHHTVPSSLPVAYAVVNPKRNDCNFPFKEICGAQVAWYLCAAIKKQINAQINMSQFLDLLSLAIVADIMPMISLNHTMVKHGMNWILKSDRPSFMVIKQMMQKSKYISDDIGFFIAPRLNSAGRLEDASISVEFLLSKNINAAQDGFEYLTGLNMQRKELQEKMSQEAISQVSTNDDIIVVYSDQWHEGVIGIVASRLVDHFAKPAFVFCANGNQLKGSARSGENDIHLYELIDAVSDCVLGFGGHRGAAGLSLEKEKLNLFKEKINGVKLEKKTDLCNSHILGELDLKSVDFGFTNVLYKYEPYGLGNAKPKFTISNIKAQNCAFMGKNKEHLKIFIQSEHQSFEAIKFNNTQQIEPSDVLDLIVSIGENEFRGNTKIQFLIEKIIKQ
ncbi:MAG: single-stranded-DNA-specific exonuclease RecJ [Campylobacterota bacterium]|nr:single-stranded-DNA-specific exonuclease RecJ [Campylobacterota bacterium]